MIHWSASDVQQYLSGALSEREMHQLEKAALEDPFLADALEGLSERAGTPLEDDLGQLRTRLANRVAQKKSTRSLPLWIRVAAAIVLLTGVGSTAWYTLLDRHNASQEVRMNDLAHRSIPQADMDTARRSMSSDLAARARPSSPATLSNANKTRVAASPVDLSSGYLKADSDNLRSLAYKNAGSPDILKKLPGADSISSLHSLEATRILPDSLFRNQTALRLSGQVVDLNNRPLANASLQVSGPSNANATTNALGQFQLNLRPQDTSQRLTVYLPGYEYRSLAVNTLNGNEATNNTIILREKPEAMKEVVLGKVGKSRAEAFATAPYDDRSEKLDSFWINVTPTTGRLAYLEYLDLAKKTLPVDSTIRGTEIISFAIGPKGQPTDLKIERSLSPAHDAGVIRLISDGAPWKALRGKYFRAMVSVSFP